MPFLRSAVLIVAVLLCVPRSPEVSNVSSKDVSASIAVTENSFPVPLVKLFQYEHCALICAGVKTEWNNEKTTLRERAEILKKMKQTHD